MHSLLVLAFCIAATGFFTLSFCVTSNSILQLNMKNEFRGRVMSLYVIASSGTAPVGNFLSGFVSEHWGPLAGYMTCGFLLLLSLSVLLCWENKYKKKTAAGEVLPGKQL
ncbi:hypothetical protein SDC9_180533 [bioreactor metagenome]|uniref:Major facilitator superfamily (MFS) profile domain-containing protein n=1 Tax=bioreactor metagenome TaxID=1076179 RepID=A0A645H2Y9_9ZZZZ